MKVSFKTLCVCVCFFFCFFFLFGWVFFHTTQLNNAVLSLQQLTLVVNANGILGKSATFDNLIDYTKPDIVLMQETKLDPSIKSGEFPARRTVYMFSEANGVRWGRLLKLLQLHSLPTWASSLSMRTGLGLRTISYLQLRPMSPVRLPPNDNTYPG